MKNTVLFFSFLLLCFSLLSSGCTKKKDSVPCDGKGTLCIENKLDSTIVISIKPTHAQYTLLKDYMNCTELDGGQAYTINVAGTGIDRDTTITITNCDKKLFIIQ